MAKTKKAYYVGRHGETSTGGEISKRWASSRTRLGDEAWLKKFQGAFGTSSPKITPTFKSSMPRSDANKAGSTYWYTGKLPAYKKGGTVQKTGPAIVHKGEKVIPANKRKMVEKILKKKGLQKNYSK